VIKKTLADIVAYDGEMVGSTRKECGNYKNLDLTAAKLEARIYLEKLEGRVNDFVYPKGDI
jgi:S-ribosylhomocysteine lyase LuxS involved in autoinducer biosynthesis